MPDSTASRLKRAVHRSPRTSREGLLERLFTFWFRGFVYTQIWEDPRVDAQALRLNDTSRILTIASGGCNVLNYLVHKPERVVAVDLNTAHLALTRLKHAALKHLPDHKSFFRFFGEARSPQNVADYEDRLRPHLDAETRAFWEERSWGGLGAPRIRFFENGLYDQGVLPRFQRVASALSALVSGTRPEALLQARTMDEQRHFFDACVAPFFDNAFVRWLGAQPAAVYSLGIPPRQQRILADASATHVVDLYRERLRKLVCGFSLSDNYFAWQAFGRRYDTEHREALPPYLREAHFGRLRYYSDVVDTHLMSVADFLRQQPDNSLDSFVLLDAMDWMDPAAITTLWRHIARVGVPGSRIIFRTAGTASVVEPALPAALRHRFTYKRDESEALHAQDRSAVYGMFHLYVLA